MKSVFFAIFASTLISLAPAQAASSLPALVNARAEMNSCFQRFENHLQENIDMMRSDHLRSMAVEHDLEDALNKKLSLFVYATRAYDYFAAAQWDWEHPLKEKTLVGKIRAVKGRLRFLDERIFQLGEIEKMQPRVTERVDALLDRLSSNQKTSFQEWMGARAALRDHEQNYYDFLGDQTRWKVYESGLANNVEWNKTMSSLQDDFYRNLSCVTALDQVKKIIPASLMVDDGTNQLAAQPLRPSVRNLSNQLSIDDLE